MNKFTLPGFAGLPFIEVAKLFYKGIFNGFISTRASSISFSFFLAFFPALIFLFTLIPYIPLENFQEDLMLMLQDVTPEETWAIIKTTIQDIVEIPRGGLLSIGFILTVYFATNGINSIIEAFNNSYHIVETRNFIKQYGIAVLLVFIFSSIIIIAIITQSFGSILINFLYEKGFLIQKFSVFFLQILKWMIISSMYFIAISFLYFYAPAKHTRFKFISAGAVLATSLFIITAMGFNIYIRYFSTYNKVYGSIGTLLIILLWIYLNSYILLFGFELNVSISKALKAHNKENK